MRFLFACLLCSCATAKPMPSVPRPSARSSVAAVLQQAEALQLTAEQRQALEAIDARLAEQVKAFRAERRLEREDRTAGQHPMRGGGRRRDPMFVGGGGAQLEARRRTRFHLDELDTAAYLDAEALLTPEQKARARQVAEAYRERLYAYRQARDDAALGVDEAPEEAPPPQ